MRFKVGDDVQIIKGTPYVGMVGMIGRIVVLQGFEDYVGIVIDGFEGHTLGGKITGNNGFWVNKSNLKIAKTSNKINY